MGWYSSALAVTAASCQGAGAACQLSFTVSDGGGAVLAGHYPFEPVLPGVALLDTSLSLLAAANPELALVRIADFRVLRPLRPGMTGEIELRPIDSPAPTWALIAQSGGEITARARLVFGQQAIAVEPADDASFDLSGHALAVDALPHAPPMRLVDVAFRDAAGNVTATWDPAAADIGALCGPAWTLPGATIPAALVLESLLQSGALLFDVARLRVSAVLLGSVRSVALAEPAAMRPLRHHVRLVRGAGDTALFAGTSVQDGRVILRCEGVTAALKPRPDVDDHHPDGFEADAFLKETIA